MIDPHSYMAMLCQCGLYTYIVKLTTNIKNRALAFFNILNLEFGNLES